MPLEARRPSEVISTFSEILTERGHTMVSVYLGLPSESPTPHWEAATQPIMWRLLKLSCARQEWESVCACCDLFVSHRRAIRSAIVPTLRVGRLPSGFAVMKTRRGALRLKVAWPALMRRKRVRCRKPPPPLGVRHATPRLSDTGVWQANWEEITRSNYGEILANSGSDLEDRSSVSSASLENYAEDRLLHLYDQVQLKRSARAKSRAETAAEAKRKAEEEKTTGEDGPRRRSEDQRSKVDAIHIQHSQRRISRRLSGIAAASESPGSGSPAPGSPPGSPSPGSPGTNHQRRLSRRLSRNSV
eukprot:gnl/TRDRNA2_/TRDRNA2_160412_c2_seq1.p1 gnl/TRDRNA2_/TRDRNA2_160412_c2~~gnl/TRDRNA2_/TRDRNA2_160412_c2_seq1.p1  ORF type:complete len:351 (+),score=22.40 gnl/TRDRNA2_/TRDRNA2_160412_c2_seq1:149-1054(+)